MTRPASTSRDLALRVLRRVEVEGGFANHLLEHAFARTPLAPEDRRLCYLLVYGVLRQRNRLDHAIAGHARYPLAGLTPWIRNCLRLGAYQLLDMPDLRSSVAVDESVRLARRYGHKGTVSLVNAVLRALAAHGEGVLPSIEKDPEAYLVIVQSHPRWLVQRWLKRYGTTTAAAICAANNTPPRLTIRWNRLKGGDPAQALPQLDANLEGVARSEVIPEGFFVHGHVPLNQVPLYREGMIDLQGLSSMLIPHLLGVEAGERVLDACAGSGGKACHMADMMHNRGEILCLDRSEPKLRALRRRARRLGAGICFPVCGSADREPPWGKSLLDRVLVDAPCSSLGTIQRHPEIRWVRREEDLPILARLQQAILFQAARAVRKGGCLVYCTCSLEPEETDEILGAFLEHHREWNRVDLGERVPATWRAMVGKDGALRSLPTSPGADGFFAFCVRK
ncbi:MAG: 16S rRNA (cytosine(967)-C(5))-methyltransferase RsmB [bacterium]